LLALAAGGAGLFILLYFFSPAEYAYYPRCVFYMLTGWQCPGCGGLRALHHLLHGRIETAFSFNPLLVVSAPCLALFAAGEGLRMVTGKDWLGPLRRPRFLWIFTGLLVAFAVARNLVPRF
jgi:hypothetical protein